jgi:hypothetical protein
LARDELLWVFYHVENLSTGKSKLKIPVQTANDKTIAPILFWMMELRDKVLERKNGTYFNLL